MLAKLKKNGQKFGNIIHRVCVTKVLQKNDQILVLSKADPEIEKNKKITKIRKIGVVP